MRPPSPALRPLLDLETACWRCSCRLTRLRRQSQQQYPAAARAFSKTAAPTSTQQRLRDGYFLGNHVLPRFGGNRCVDLGARARKLRGAGVSSASARGAEAPESATASGTAAAAGGLGGQSLDSSTSLEQGGASGRRTRGLGELPPHRRRWAAKHAAASTDPGPPTPSNTSGAETPALAPLPLDASATLAQAAARHPANSARRVLSALLSLTKPRLTVLVVLTAMAPYALYPVPSFVAAGAGAAAAAGGVPSLSPITLGFLTVGTALCSAAANTLNMAYEPDTDSRMSRTRARPLVRSLLSTRAAMLFAAACGLAGIVALYFGVNPTVSFLGGANIVLYAAIYTPLKRVSAVNTWVGAVVGAIPPLMGWAAAAGESATGEGSWRELLLPGVDLVSGAHPHQQPLMLLQLDEGPGTSSSSSSSSGGGSSGGSSGSSEKSPTAAASLWGGWLLAALLFGWQFPHFMALSWPVRDEYRAAGLRMLAWTDPARNARVALRYSVAMVPVCLGLCAAGVVEWSFAATSLPANAWLVSEAWRFWKCEGRKKSVCGGATAAAAAAAAAAASTSSGGSSNMPAKLSASSARGLFWATVWYLPVVMVLALVQKKGMWGRVWRSVFGEDEDDWEEYGDEWNAARTEPGS